MFSSSGRSGNGVGDAVGVDVGVGVELVVGVPVSVDVGVGVAVPVKVDAGVEVAFGVGVLSGRPWSSPQPMAHGAKAVAPAATPICRSACRRVMPPE